MPKVRDVMTSEPIVLQRGQPIAEAARAMRDSRVGSVCSPDLVAVSADDDAEEAALTDISAARPNQ